MDVGNVLSLLPMSPSNELTNSPKASHLPLLKKKRIIPNTVLPLPNKNQHVRSSALCREMLAYGKFVDMADQGHFTEDEIEALDEQHQKKMKELQSRNLKIASAFLLFEREVW
jgi:hypothetical protein